MRLNPKLLRLVAAILLTIAAGDAGYLFAEADTGNAVTVTAPPPGSMRVVYSLDQKQNDQEIIALIDAAKTHIYFAMYEFTLQNIADALVAAKERGVEVRGLVDAGESANSYDQPIMQELVGAGIPVEVQKHVGGNGIMHIKAIVTDSAYALGSYNWTSSATNVNDEILEIGTDPTLRQTYEDLLKKLLNVYSGTSAVSKANTPKNAGTISYTEAGAYVGSYASVKGTLIEAYTSASGTVFLDFCENYKTCPFTAIIFADDAKKFGDLTRLNGKTITITGTITSYKDQPEIVVSRPDQISF